MSDQDQKFRLFAVMDLVSATSVEGVFFGIGLTLWFLCLQLLYKDLLNHDRRKRAIFSFFYSLLIVLCAAISFTTNTQLNVLAFIDHNGSLLQSLRYIVTWDSHPPAFVVLNCVGPILIILLTGMMQVWRIWVIWTSSPYAIAATILPLLTILAAVALDSAAQYYSFVAPSYTSAAAGHRIDQIGVANVALYAAFNILISLLVVGRVWLVRRRLGKLMGTTFTEHTQQYTNVVAIFIESYALLAVCYIANTLVWAIDGIGIGAVLLAAITEQVEMIAYLLVLYRVLLGRAWTGQTERQLSTLQWNHDNGNGLSSGGTISRVSHAHHENTAGARFAEAKILPAV